MASNRKTAFYEEVSDANSQRAMQMLKTWIKRTNGCGFLDYDEICAGSSFLLLHFFCVVFETQLNDFLCFNKIYHKSCSSLRIAVCTLCAVRVQKWNLHFSFQHKHNWKCMESVGKCIFDMVKLNNDMQLRPLINTNSTVPKIHSDVAYL